MQTIFNIVVPIFSLMALGAAFGRLGLLPHRVGEALAAFVFSVAAPALLFRTMATAHLGDTDPFRLWLAYFGAAAIVWAAASLFARLILKADRRKSVIAGVAACFANTVFVSLPTIQRAYGVDGLGPLLIVLSIHMPVMTIASTLLIEDAARRDAKEKGDAAATVSLSTVLGRVSRSLARNPLIIGIVAGTVWRLTGLPLAGNFGEMVDLVAGTAGPLALFSLGMTLTRYGVSGNVVAACVIAFASIVVMPALVYALGMLVGLSAFSIKIAVITAAAPAGVNAYLFATYFGSGERLAATSILLSTVGSVVTLSAWLSLFG